MRQAKVNMKKISVNVAAAGLCAVATFGLTNFVLADQTADLPATMVAPPPIGNPPSVAPESNKPPKVTRKIGQTGNWNISAGFLHDLQSKGKDSSFYLVQQNGKQMAASGKAFANTDVVAVNLPSVDSNDKQNYQLRIEKGTAQISSGILDTYVSSNLPILNSLASALKQAFELKELQEFRGTVAINSTADFKKTTFQGGLETPALHPLGFLNSGPDNGLNVVNWTFLSVLNESQNSGVTGNGQQDVGLFAYRSKLGRGFRPVAKDATLTPSETDSLVATVTAEAIKISEAKCIINGQFNMPALKAYANSIDGNTTNEAEQAVRFVGRQFTAAINVNDPQEQWEQGLTKQVKLRYKTVHLSQSSVEAWIDSAGWYQFTGQTGGRHRFTNLMTASIRYYINAGSGNDNWIMLRYENGKERATPDVYKDDITLSTGFAF